MGPDAPLDRVNRANLVRSPVAQRVRDLADEDGYVKGGTQRYASAAS